MLYINQNLAMILGWIWRFLFREQAKLVTFKYFAEFQRKLCDIEFDYAALHPVVSSALLQIYASFIARHYMVLYSIKGRFCFKIFTLIPALFEDTRLLNEIRHIFL